MSNSALRLESNGPGLLLHTTTRDCVPGFSSTFGYFIRTRSLAASRTLNRGRQEARIRSKHLFSPNLPTRERPTFIRTSHGHLKRTERSERVFSSITGACSPSPLKFTGSDMPDVSHSSSSSGEGQDTRVPIDVDAVLRTVREEAPRRVA
ncbi:hypothetical protein NUW54_g11269 [Trametes sanguinea]|uniref:Uncharacterized protein n=1 Tax=Trametes sanguinea TaxID=158606 RepID=A0ACC1NJ42_9APHY|nr:hypothetical protein NUW54_g11269 [Trametes sanguinea]